MQDVDTVDKKIILLDELESNRLNIPLPQVNGYKWGWIRFALGGYTSNVTPEKDDKHLKSAVENGWMPCVKSPHPELPLNKAGYITAGDLVLCLRKVDENMVGCVFLANQKKSELIE